MPTGQVLTTLERELALFPSGTLPQVRIGNALSPVAPAVHVLDARGHVLAFNGRGRLLLTEGGLVGEEPWTQAIGAVRAPERLQALHQQALSSRGFSVEAVASIASRGDVVFRCASPEEGIVVAVMVDIDHASAPPTIDHDSYPESRRGPYPVFLLDRATLTPFFANERGRALLREDAEDARERSLSSLVVPVSRRQLVVDASLVNEATIWTGPYDALDGSGPLEIGLVASEHGGLPALIAVVVPRHEP